MPNRADFMQMSQALDANHHDSDPEERLPPTKIQRKYYCKSCNYITTNPRHHLTHLQEVHKQKVKIVKCPLCVYACQYRQKLSRHLRLIHEKPNQAQALLANDINNNDTDTVNNESSIANLNDFFADSSQQLASFQLPPTARQPTASEAGEWANFQMVLQQQQQQQQQLSQFEEPAADNLMEQEEPLNLSNTYPNELRDLVTFITQAFRRELEQFILINYASFPQ